MDSHLNGICWWKHSPISYHNVSDDTQTHDDNAKHHRGRPDVLRNLWHVVEWLVEAAGAADATAIEELIFKALAGGDTGVQHQSTDSAAQFCSSREAIRDGRVDPWTELLPFLVVYTARYAQVAGCNSLTECAQ